MLDEITSLVIDVDIVNEHFTDVGAEIIPNGPNDEITLIDEEWGRAFRCSLYRLPDFQEIVQIPLEFGAFRPTPAVRTMSPIPSECLGAEGLAKVCALVTFNAPRDATSAGIVRHQDQITTS